MHSIRDSGVTTRAQAVGAIKCGVTVSVRQDVEASRRPCPPLRLSDPLKEEGVARPTVSAACQRLVLCFADSHHRLLWQCGRSFARVWLRRQPNPLRIQQSQFAAHLARESAQYHSLRAPLHRLRRSCPICARRAFPPAYCHRGALSGSWRHPAQKQLRVFRCQRRIVADPAKQLHGPRRLKPISILR